MFRFTTRELFLLTAVVAIFLRWFLAAQSDRELTTDLRIKNGALSKSLRQRDGEIARMRQALQRANTRAEAAEKATGHYVPMERRN